jgi:predicted DNA-binding transcriptional regulator YafY
MSRATRLLELLQLLRRHRYPIAGAALAAELGISLRTLYRDIAELQAQGAQIEGEAGIGYLLRPGFMLPPLMFAPEELEALVLGSRWVAQRADEHLAAAARNALAKIDAVLPAELRHELDSNALLVVTSPPEPDQSDLAALRMAIRRERKLTVRYRDQQGEETERTLWPFALAFFERVRMLAAWCELRQDYRHFRTDRIVAMTVHEERYPRRRQALMKDWKEQQGIASR